MGGRREPTMNPSGTPKDAEPNAKGPQVAPEWATFPTSLDWHVWMPCNLACRFCFKTLPGFLSAKPVGSPLALNRAEARRILEILKCSGIEKITYAGGEPTLHPFLHELLEWSHDLGMTVMVVTNGHLFTEGYVLRIAPFLDAVKISIDSADEATQKALGRGGGDHVARALEAARLVKQHEVPLMLNTVVTALNWNEDMTPLVSQLAPVRWKVFQALPEKGENDRFRDWASDEQFRRFLETNARGNPVSEPNDLMRGSYIMMDPLGRLMQDSPGHYVYSVPVQEVGFIRALAQVGWDSERFVRRGGLYGWRHLRDVSARDNSDRGRPHDL